MRKYTKIPFTLCGSSIEADVEIYSREGTKSPSLWIIIYDGKRYVPRAAQLIGLHSTMHGLLCIMYSDVDLHNLIYNRNPFLSMITKNDSWNGAYVPIPGSYNE